MIYALIGKHYNVEVQNPQRSKISYSKDPALHLATHFLFTDGFTLQQDNRGFVILSSWWPTRPDLTYEDLYTSTFHLEKKCSQSCLLLKCFPDTTQTQNPRFQTVTAIATFNSFPLKDRLVGKEPVTVFLHETTKKGQKGSIWTEVSQTSAESWVLLLACTCIQCNCPGTSLPLACLLLCEVTLAHPVPVDPQQKLFCVSHSSCFLAFH